MKCNPITLRLKIILVLLSISLTPLFSQNDHAKFGKIDLKELQSAWFEKDTSAEAVVLFDQGKTHLICDQYEGFINVFERHLRIKIFKKSGFKYATQEFSMCRYANQEPGFLNYVKNDQLSFLNGCTYNLENGKIVETKLENETVTDEFVTPTLILKKIIMPAIREGSVFEINYMIRSPFLIGIPNFNMKIVSGIRDWTFQSSIPTLYSEYEVKIPEYFHYKQQTTGNLPFDVEDHKTESATESIMISFYDPSQNKLVPIHTYLSANFTVFITKLALNDIPAMKPEPFMTTIDNYRQKIEFEFLSYQFPDFASLTSTTTWEEVVSTLLNDEKFGGQLKKSGFIKDLVAGINASAEGPYDKMLLAFEKIKKMMNWNGKFSKYPVTNIREALNKKNGNSADINLLLTKVLKDLGLDAVPVVLSTRSNGIVKPYPPVISKFNNVIVRVKIDTSIYLLDATDKYSSFDQLPFECLNGSGLLVKEGPMEWIQMLGEERSGNFREAKMKIGSTGKVTGTLTVSASGYPATTIRQEYAGKGEENYKVEAKERMKNWNVEKIEFENILDLGRPVKTTYTISTGEVPKPNEFLYFNVLFNQGQQYNPFADPERKYPVDFGCILKDNYLFVIEIPEGFRIESIPAPMRLSLENQGATFKFDANISENKITVISSMTIKQVFFGPEEYKGLREFFNRIVTKHAEQIVLKKI